MELAEKSEDMEYLEAREMSSSRQGHRRNNLSYPQSPRSEMSGSQADSEGSSDQTAATSLPPLQQKGLEDDRLEPVDEEDLDPGSFDLVAPVAGANKQYSLETRSELLFSTEHLKEIFADPSLLLQFTGFLGAHRRSSVPILIYYLDALKALRALEYANFVAESLEPIPGFDFTTTNAKKSINEELQEKARQAFEVMVREELPAFITHIYTQTVSLSIQRRITGTLPAHLREASEGLAEVFCLTDPSRPDNPIVFASEGKFNNRSYVVPANRLQNSTKPLSMGCHM